MKTNEKLKQLREQFNLTQQNLADILHVSHQAISNWEQGKSMPDINFLKALSEIYGTTVDKLLNPQVEHIIETLADLEKKYKDVQETLKRFQGYQSGYPVNIGRQAAKDEVDYYRKAIKEFKRKQQNLKEQSKSKWKIILPCFHWAILINHKKEDGKNVVFHPL